MAISEKLRGAYPTASEPLLERLQATVDRIGERVDEWVALEAEKVDALAWCRKNGNPHLRKEPPHAH